MISLLDMAGTVFVDAYLVFRRLPAETKKSPLWKLLKPGFDHVEVWRHDRGIWLRVDPCWEIVQVEAHEAPPWEWLPAEVEPKVVRVQRVVPHAKLREPFFIGPWTCVEMAKAFIGLRAPFARTPWQLYKELKKDKH